MHHGAVRQGDATSRLSGRHQIQLPVAGLSTAVIAPQQLRRLQPAEPLLGHHQHLPDDRYRPIHPLAALGASVLSRSAANSDSTGLVE